MQIGDIVKVGPETLRWDPEIEAIVGEIENTKIVITKNRMGLQSFRAMGFNQERKIQRILKEGFSGEVWSMTEEKAEISLVRLQTYQLDKIRIGNIYEGTIEVIGDEDIFVNIGGIGVRVYFCECSRAQVTELSEIYKVGENVKVKIVDKEHYFPYYVKGSIKRAYPTLETEASKYSIGEQIEVKVCDRLNLDGYWIEVTPGIPGILNIPEEETDQIKTGQRLIAEINQIDIRKGIKCKLPKK